MFFVGAIWNWIVALSLLFGADAMRSLTGTTMPIDPLGKQLFSMCVIVFGLGYYIVSRDVSRNEGIVMLGIVGKLGVVAVFFQHAVAGDVPLVLLAPAMVDLVFAGLFAEFLWRGREPLSPALQTSTPQ